MADLIAYAVLVFLAGCVAWSAVEIWKEQRMYDYGMGSTAVPPDFYENPIPTWPEPTVFHADTEAGPRLQQQLDRIEAKLDQLLGKRHEGQPDYFLNDSVSNPLA